MNSANSNGITPSIDDILSAVNDELDERICVKPVSEVTAQVDNSTVKNETAGVDLFNASQWYLQNYPVVIKKKPAPASSAKTGAIPIAQLNADENISEPITDNSSKYSKIKKVVIAIVIIAVLIWGIIFLPYLIESTAFEGQTMQDTSYYTSAQVKESIENGFTTRNVVNMYGSPDYRYFGAINYHCMIYHTSDGEFDIWFDNNGYIIGSEAYTW